MGKIPFVQREASYKAQREIRRGREGRDEAPTVPGVSIGGVKAIPDREPARQQGCPCCKQHKHFLTAILCLTSRFLQEDEGCTLTGVCQYPLVTASH